MVEKPKSKKINRKKRQTKKKTFRSFEQGQVGKELAYVFNSPVKPEWKGKLNYSETFQLTTGTAGVAGTHQSFILNSLYDPNFTGTGHQPYGFDQLTNFYLRYIVEKVKVTLIWSNVGTTNDVVGFYKINASGAAGTVTGATLDYITEQNSSSTIYISSSGNQRVVEQNFVVDIPKVFGMKKMEWVDDGNYSLYTANPTRAAMLYIDVASPSGTSGIAVVCQAIFEYQCRFRDRLDLTQS